MTSEMYPRHREFYVKLADLLEEYDVDLYASGDCYAYGQQTPQIDVEFNDPYRLDELKNLVADTAREMSKQESYGEKENG